MGGRWQIGKNNKLILTEIFPSVLETWYLKLLYLTIIYFRETKVPD